MRSRIQPILVSIAVLASLGGPAGAGPSGGGAGTRPVVREARGFAATRPLRDMGSGPARSGTFVAPHHPARPAGATEASPGPAPLPPTERSAPAPLAGFDGISNADNQAVFGGVILPPDPNIDVGPNHIVEMTNSLVAVYGKNGALLLGPLALHTIWEGIPGLCGTTDYGDPVVLYDPLADRWLLSQFAFGTDPNGEPIPPMEECIAVSQTADPTGAYFAYDFFLGNDIFHDYPKFGVWPDAYYMSSRQFPFVAGNFGSGAFAFERDAMLVGDPGAQQIYFDGCALSADLCVNPNLLPADLDGDTPPPPGAPGQFATFNDTQTGLPPGMEVFDFVADWANPGSSTFTGPAFVPTSDYDPDLCGGDVDCIPQRDTPRGLDALSFFFMHRLAYRNFGTEEVLAASHTVDVDGSNHAGIRWHLLTRTGGGWGLDQEGTIAPDPNHRWVGSIAMDRFGNTAVGYSVSGGNTFPSIRYTGRAPSDPPGTMQAEGELLAGSGSQTHPAGRWGDYTALVVDPSDDCTFWYVNEYYGQTSQLNWRTRIGSFLFPDCGGFEQELAAITMVLRGHLRARGNMTSESFDCFGERAVRIQQRRSGVWVTIKRATTDDTGFYSVRIRDRAGSYRALAPDDLVEEAGRFCLGVASRRARHRH